MIPQPAPLGAQPPTRSDATGREPFRPTYHFTPARNWMNDPNGMVYYDGEYHLFYQYNPFGDRWGHMSWGHAVSRDLISWEHLPLALAEENNVMVFSGSAVVDWKNTSGFGKNGKPPLIAIYTGHYTNRPLQNQHIAYSNDRGRTWTKYSANPVLDVNMADFRDPKVFWHEPAQAWIMVLALATEQKVHFYRSPNLKEWKYVGEFGPAGAVNGLWECPDLFELPTTDGGKKWVLIVNINPGGPAGGSGCQYFVGDFDGSKFVAAPLPPERAEFIPQGRVLADFEKDYGGWKAEGKAFGHAPAKGTLPNQQPVTGFRGQGLVNSYHEGDSTRGTLTSPTFEIDAGYLSFLIGGGKHAETRIDLRIDGQVVRTASGHDRERLTWHAWDVREFKGKQAQLQIVDDHSGGWGHINIDEVLLADQPARAADESANWADWGADFYAAVSWSDIPTSDGRRLWIGWMSNWNYANDVPTTPWRSAMSVPRELSLVSTPSGHRLQQRPVHELHKWRGKVRQFPGGTAAAANDWIREQGLRCQPMELHLELPAAKSGTHGLKLFRAGENETVITVDRGQQTISIDRTRSGFVEFHQAFPSKQTAPLTEPLGKLNLRVLVDACSIEVFLNDGETCLTTLVFPKPEQTGWEVFSSNADSQIEALQVWPLVAPQP